MRIVDWPEPILLTRVDWLSGPMARNSGSQTAPNGAEATFTGVGEALAFRYQMALNMGTGERRERGYLLSLANGANWSRVRLILGDEFSNEELGVQSQSSSMWSNGQPWANGQPWPGQKPPVEIAATVGFHGTIVKLKDQFWGHKLGIGDPIGFFPFYLGAHFVTEVIEPGEYRVWPRLRKQIPYNADPSLNSYATLDPILMMKTRPGGTSMSRGPVHSENVAVEMFEVHDYYAREAFGA
jgi:hypothetical protein